jgi:hypothetical protein
MKPQFWLATLATLIIAACGGGGTTAGINGGGNSVGGINGGGIALGPITGFGSVHVNGIQFTTTGTTISIEGAAAGEAQLKVGQIVEVRGTLNGSANTGTATTITAADQLEGPVQSVDVPGLSFTVLGNIVRVTGTTVFDDSFPTPSLAGLTVGQWVEVYGLRNSAGDVVATRVEPKPAGGEIELNGTVSALDTNARTFRLGNATISYGNVTPQGTLANGACAEVKGTSFVGTTLTATRVEIKSCGLTAANNDVGRIEGFVTRFASAADFDVGAQRVSTSASTTYVGGTATDLALNRRVEVEGTFNSTGVLAASKVAFKADTTTRFQGTIDALDAAARTLTIFGVTISTSASTSYDDNSNARQRPFGFANLRTGDYVEVRGSEGSTPLTAAANLLERDDLDTRRELQSTARNVAAPNFTLVGVQVVTNGATEFRDLADSPITQAQFFAQIAGRGVKVRGSFAGGTFTATRAELENLN